VSRNGAGSQSILDDLLTVLQASELSVLELRVLLHLADHNASPAHLADALDTEPKTIGRATRSLAMRGLIGRWFEESGRESHFEFRIRSGGRGKLVPYAELLSEKRRLADNTPGAAPACSARRNQLMISPHWRRQLSGPAS
jgi:hypothetical protein